MSLEDVEHNEQEIKHETQKMKNKQEVEKQEMVNRHKVEESELFKFQEEQKIILFETHQEETNEMRVAQIDELGILALKHNAMAKKLKRREKRADDQSDGVSVAEFVRDKDNQKNACNKPLQQPQSSSSDVHIERRTSIEAKIK